MNQELYLDVLSLVECEIGRHVRLYKFKNNSKIIKIQIIPTEIAEGRRC